MIRPVEMMQTARRAAALALVAVALSARGQAGDGPPRFRLFPQAAEAPPPSAPDRAFVPPAKESGKEKRFWMAAGELLGLELVSWGFDRYVANQSNAHISWATVRANFEAGFTYDGDKFLTNQLGHSYGGGFYYNAARSNGFNFWESTLFTATGSAIWELTAEIQGPSLNDFVNTTLGGAVSGEVCHRLSQMILDDRARGGARVAREALAGLINPSQLLTRLLTGELGAVRPERGDYLEPSRLVAQIDAGWRHIASSPRSNPDQALVTALVRYGDPFDRSVSRPLDVFDVGIDLSHPESAWLSRVDIHGLLGAWELDPGSAGARHLLGVYMNFEYANKDTYVFSSQSFRFGLLSMRPLGNGVELRAEALGAVAPLAALRNDHVDESSDLVKRSYDYGPGAGLDAAVRVRWRELDLVTLAYSLFWMHTSNGIMRNSTLQAFRVEARLPVAGPLSVGGSWAWNQRISTYDDFDTVHTDGTVWHAFVSWIFR